MNKFLTRMHNSDCDYKEDYMIKLPELKAFPINVNI